ncbi:MAG: N-acetylmuramoyl-L-alanine amidase [Acutalibacteraceae bacterium]
MNICISIGHGKSAKGGYDSGALGGNYQEFKIGREIGKYIGEVFKGYACTADVINYDATLYLTERIAHVNKHGYDLAIEIHSMPQAAQARRSITSTRAQRVKSSRRQSARA